MKKLGQVLFAACAFFGAIFVVVWLTGGPRHQRPITGETCVDVINRIYTKGRSYRPTPAEQLDLDACGNP